jgi:putative transposase
LPLKEKAPKRLTATYKRNGTIALIAALAVHTAKFTAKTMKTNNANNFLAFLKKPDRAYTRKTLHVIVDQPNNP